MKTHGHSQALVLVTDQKKCTHQWRLMGARVKMIWEIESCKTYNTLHSDTEPHGIDDQTPSLWERTQPSIQEAYDTLRNKYTHTSHRRSFLLPYIFFHLSSPHYVDKGFVYQLQVQIQILASRKESPSFSLTSQLYRAYPSQHVKIIFWSIEIFWIFLVTDSLV